ncbi:xanthine dehydrogenase, molybdenum binding subunit apoprotein [Maribacter sedimenticola]|uniref:Xanthine dehydrogenase, molybdenum binding subunit apoprotein n=1 Tax=Maribacter sedimenticola TaxID=228956 RepID=A0ABY1SJW2_9FLAO|nr:xanthine dehydrogenase family protein molybdopterin-binding subunit [Maribacter sedimenticola]SNR63361.1 xanthine dehydrogenase, molybdenum binding subunit apoprotein [Maribacter sedimenticola]
MDTAYIGKSRKRVDGVKKVTGSATYAGEFKPEGLVHGYVVNSTIANGKIVAIHTGKAKMIDGVLDIFTHENLPDDVRQNVDYTDPLSPPGHPFRPLYNDQVLYNGQPIALVVAESFELARYAAGLVEVEYLAEECTTDIKKNMGNATTEGVEDTAPDRGNAELSYANAAVKIDVEYSQPRHYHNPMEPHVSIAEWNAKTQSFKIYDKVQGVNSSQEYICGIFNLDTENVQILSPYVGGGFGSGLRPQYQLFLAAMAARELQRPVKVSLTRRQMFSFGHRPACIQQLQMGASKEGKLKSIIHKAYGETSKFEKYNETIVDWSGMMYQCDNVKLEYRLIPVNVYTPMDMRAPGGATGMFALECAMDELAIKANIDPLEFRLLNYADKDQNEDKPFSSKELRECYRQAASHFGWYNRHTKTQIKDDSILVGYGMATGCWEAMQQKSSAKAVLTSSGKLVVSSSTADIGTGTYTVMSQIAGDTLGIAMEEITFQLGDTSLPKAPIEGGSWTVSSVGSAVKAVCNHLKKQLIDLAKVNVDEDLDHVNYDEVSCTDGTLLFPNGTLINMSTLLLTAGLDSIEAENALEPEVRQEQYSSYAHSCVMVEVHVDKDLGMITVPRVTSAIAGGRIINPKTAESQILGAITWGIGMALEEEGMIDDRSGRIMNANLAEYHMAVHADVQQLNVLFVEEHDDIVNPLGAKGLGEIGIVGVASAIANAVFDASGKRVRNLPITLDKLLE